MSITLKKNNLSLIFTAKIILSVFLVIFLFFLTSFNIDNVYINAEILENSNQSAKELTEDLKAQLKELQDQIEGLQKSIENTKSESKTLSNATSILTDQIKKKELEIKEIELSIKKLASDINKKSSKIKTLNDRIKNEKLLTAEYMRQLYEYEKTGSENFFLYGDFSKYIFYIESIKNVQTKIHYLTSEMKVLKDKTEKEQADLEDDKEEALRFKKLENLENSSLKKKRDQKKELLKKTQGQEKVFSKILKESKKTALEIRKRLFLLEGGKKITFGEAIDSANKLSKKVDIRPAFLLAILQKETRLGDFDAKGSWKKDLYDCFLYRSGKNVAESEKKAFFSITAELGVSPDDMAVSRSDRVYKKWCGGAMGPAQFLPTTWLSYKGKISELTKNNPPNPWNIDDAFAAAAIKLSGNGANTKKYKDEHKAAAIYFAGGSWHKSSGQKYANHVMDIAEDFQQEINNLSQPLSYKNQSSPEAKL